MLPNAWVRSGVLILGALPHQSPLLSGSLEVPLMWPQTPLASEGLCSEHLLWGGSHLPRELRPCSQPGLMWHRWVGDPAASQECLLCPRVSSHSAASSASLDTGCISLVPLDFNFWLIFVSHNVFVWPQCFQPPKTGCAFTLHEALGGVQDGGESSSLEGGRQCQEITRNPTRGGEGMSDGTVG